MNPSEEAVRAMAASTEEAVAPSVEACEPQWWRSAVVYAVYPTSFADSDGDGVGDLVGLRERLGYIADLGADAIWLCPWNPSPMVDGGYDVSDYCDINPLFGTLEDARALIADAHARGMRIIVDLVANHTSDQHPWFTAAVAAGPGSAERERYLFRDGRGEHGELPPNSWISAFGDSGWTRVTEQDGTPGQWYFHVRAAAAGPGLVPGAGSGRLRRDHAVLVHPRRRWPARGRGASDGKGSRAA